jgi:hypothetical protein
LRAAVILSNSIFASNCCCPVLFLNLLGNHLSEAVINALFTFDSLGIPVIFSIL